MTRIGCFILCLSLSLSGRAQTGGDTEWALPTLQTLIDSALIHSPILKGADGDILMSRYELTDAHRDWMQKINFTIDGRYGSMFDYSRLANAGAFIPLSDNIYAMNYGVGMSAYMPISDMFDRKRKLQKAKLKIEQTENKRDETARMVKQSVITAYYDVLAAQKTLAARSEISLSANMLYDQSRLDYAESRITLAEFTKANETYLHARNEVETQKFTLLKAVRILEVIVGIELVK
jgi:outer membrane protein TolC